MQNVVSGLVIKDPYITYILEGKKDWEMRSKPTQKRGWIALIKKSSGRVFGVAKLVGCEGPMSLDEMMANLARHRIPEMELLSGEVAGWNVAWRLESPILFRNPIPYDHPSGAVTWINLSSNVTAVIARELRTLDGEKIKQSATTNIVPDSVKPVLPPGVRVARNTSPSKPVVSSRVNRPVSPTEDNREELIPVAKDGSEFTPDVCHRNGNYTVGEKGNEHKFRNYAEALAYLRKMATAKWRRPNAAGNWGIVSAISWKKPG